MKKIMPSSGVKGFLYGRSKDMVLRRGNIGRFRSSMFQPRVKIHKMDREATPQERGSATKR